MRKGSHLSKEKIRQANIGKSIWQARYTKKLRESE